VCSEDTFQTEEPPYVKMSEFVIGVSPYVPKETVGFAWRHESFPNTP